MNTGLWNMDSGLAALPRPGMTNWYRRCASNYWGAQDKSVPMNSGSRPGAPLGGHSTKLPLPEDPVVVAAPAVEVDPPPRLAPPPPPPPVWPEAPELMVLLPPVPVAPVIDVVVVVPAVD